MDQFRSVISRLSGGGTPAINKALEQHHAEVTANAIRHSETAKRYYGMVAQAKATGNNPLTGKPATPEEMAQWQQMADGAWADYTKIAGKSKQAKPIIQQVGGLLKHITGGGGQQQPGQPGQPGGPQGAPAQQGSQTVPPPPQGASAAQASPQPQAAGGPQATTQGQQTVPPPPQGDLSSQGNIDLYNRPHVKNADGSTSTVRSIGIEEDGQQIVIPTVSPDGKVLSNQDAIQLYKRSGKYLGKFKTQKEADDFAAKLHQQYASGMYDHPAGKATVPPVPTMPEGMEGPTIDKLEKEQDTLRLKDEEYRNKLAADSDPRYHVNEIKQLRGDIQGAFPDMSPEDVQKAVFAKMGVTPKGTGKEMQPDFKDGMLVGVKDPADNAYYTDPATMPPAALTIWKSGKHVEQEHESAQEAKENRQFLVQERLAGLREQIHDREQELAQSTKIPATEAGRASQAEIIKEQTADLREQLKDPELQKYMGPIAGRTTGAAARLYNKKVQNFFAAQESLDALLPLLHGYRGGAQTHKTFKDAMGSLTIDPKAYAGTLDALDSMADNVTNEVQEEYPNAPMFKNKRDAGRPSSNARPRGRTVKPPPGSTVKMKAPNGMTKDVSADQVDHYKSLGATVVQ